MSEQWQVWMMLSDRLRGIESQSTEMSQAVSKINAKLDKIIMWTQRGLLIAGLALLSGGHLTMEHLATLIKKLIL